MGARAIPSLSRLISGLYFGDVDLPTAERLCFLCCLSIRWIISYVITLAVAFALVDSLPSVLKFTPQLQPSE